MRRTSLSLIILAAATAACAEPLEFADWLIDVPPGTEVTGLRAIPLEERSPDAVRLVDDLVLGDNPDSSEALFYRPAGIVAAPDGRMFVADRGDQRVLMFAPDGEYLGSFGREGQGPGEFGFIMYVAVAGEHIVVDDSGNRRISVWTSEGEHVADHSQQAPLVHLAMEGLDDSTLVSSFFEDTATGDRRLVVVQRAIDGSELARLLQVPTFPANVVRDGESSAEEMVRNWIATRDWPAALTAAGGGTVYLSPQHEYQVLASNPDATIRWALRVAWTRPPLAESTKAALVERYNRFGTGMVAVGGFEWPPASALEFLRTDGAGNLYVFPTMPREEGDPPAPRMVDVYSPEGELLAAGLVDHVWSFARGDYVYGLRTNEREEQVAVRYRLTVNPD